MSFAVADSGGEKEHSRITGSSLATDQTYLTESNASSSSLTGIKQLFSNYRGQ